VGRKSGNYAGIVIPYYSPGSDCVREYRLRRDQPDFEYDSDGNLNPRQKYLSPPGRSNMLYFAPRCGQSLLQDPAQPVVITEGEFKTLALWRLAHHNAPTGPRFLPVGVSGVYNWRGTIGKTVGPDGSRLDVKGSIPDLDWLAWHGRRVVIAYDADAVTKDLVRIARSELAAHLRSRGALVGFREWGVAKGKGIDDLAVRQQGGRVPCARCRHFAGRRENTCRGIINLAAASFSAGFRLRAIHCERANGILAICADAASTEACLLLFGTGRRCGTLCGWYRWRSAEACLCLSRRLVNRS